MSKLNKYFEKELGLPLIYHDYETYDWQSAKYGTIVVDPKENNIGIKLRYNVDQRDPKDPFSTYGPSWVALKIRGDETVIVEESSRMLVDKIVYVKYDMVEGKLYYTINGKSKVSDATRQNNFVFELDKGEYIPGNHHIKALINNTIECSPATRTLKELDSKHIVLNSTQLEQGCEIDVYYVERYDIKNPVPRIFNQKAEPENPESGDFWITSHPSESMKQKLPLNIFIRYDYNSMQLLVLIKTISGSTIKINKNEAEQVNQVVNRSWSTFRIPIQYNEIFNLTVEGINDWYLDNSITKHIVTTSKVDIALSKQTLTNDNTIIYLQGHAHCNFNIISAVDTSDIKFLEYEEGKYRVILPRQLKSYFIDIVARKVNKLQTTIKSILIRAKDPVEIPLEITSKEIHLESLASQYANVTVTATYHKEPHMVINSNYPDGITLVNKVINNDKVNFNYHINLDNGQQYLSFIVDDKEGNALSRVISTRLPRKKIKEISEECDFIEANNYGIIPANKYYILNGSKYVKMYVKALANSTLKLQNLNEYNTATIKFIGRSVVDSHGCRKYNYLIPCDTIFRNSDGTPKDQSTWNLSMPYVKFNVHIEDPDAVDLDYVVNKSIIGDHI
nr:MAG TPA: hypothetical protein [Caudoviricetes sp.]